MSEDGGRRGVLAACDLPAWATGTGPWADIVVSTRAAVSRNLAGLNFPHRAGVATKQRVLEAVIEAAQAAGRHLSTALRPYLATEVSEVERQALWEAYQVHLDRTPSPDHSALILSEDRRLCAVVNGEDHVRFTCLLSGLSTQNACETAAAVADAFGECLEYARHRSLGHLTARPALVGTGMRVSLLAHLAALQKLGRLPEALRSAADVGTATTSLLPAAGHSHGGLVELSNRRTAGVDAAEVAASLEETTRHLVTFEQQSRDLLMRERRQEMVDETWRALATLRHARLLSSAEALAHLSTLRLGAGLGIVRGLDARAINRLSLLAAPGLLQTRVGRALPESERRSLRAKIVRASLKPKST
jgi:protein arginine kinase